MNKIIIITGVLLVIIGLAWPYLGKLPIGRLPGDIIYQKNGLSIYIPITTTILASIILTLIFYFFRK